VNGRQLLVVTLPGRDPGAGSVGFVHHADVVQPEGEWKLGEPFSAKLTQDAEGREVMVGRGTLDTKGPTAQILVAMKHLKESGQTPERTVKLFVFPDEEFGGKEGAWLLSRRQPELFRDVRYWVTEGSGVFSPEMVGGMLGPEKVPYLAVAQKFTIPMQLKSKAHPTADAAVRATQGALARADEYIEGREWTFLGSKSETRESMRRLGEAVGGMKGFLIKHFWNFGFMRKRMGKSNVAANRSDFCKTDFYLQSNPAGKAQGSNIKPSSATLKLELQLQGADRAQALHRMQQAVGSALRVVDDEQGLRLTLPQENYHGGNHGSTADRDQDAIDVTLRGLDQARQALKKKGWDDQLQVLDVYTSKNGPGAENSGPASTVVTLDFRVAVGEDPKTVMNGLKRAVGEGFELTPLFAEGEWDARVRRLSHQSPLFKAAEASSQAIYGGNVLFGNTTASNDTRFLMEANPQSETLTFTPVVYTRNGAHGPDEAISVRGLQQGVDWLVDFMRRV
jgi:acetylornithine deacetylase/succinyl-diaminopimelate desuccinylase-like protein